MTRDGIFRKITPQNEQMRHPPRICSDRRRRRRGYQEGGAEAKKGWNKKPFLLSSSRQEIYQNKLSRRRTNLPPLPSPALPSPSDFRQKKRKEEGSEKASPFRSHPGAPPPPALKPLSGKRGGFAQLWPWSRVKVVRRRERLANPRRWERGGEGEGERERGEHNARSSIIWSNLSPGREGKRGGGGRPIWESWVRKAWGKGKKYKEKEGRGKNSVAEEEKKKKKMRSKEAGALQT